MSRQQMNINPSRQGGHYVRYPDGYETGFMCSTEAYSLRSIFGGEVHYDPRWKGTIPGDKPKRRINWQMVAIVAVFCLMLFAYMALTGK